MFINNKNYSKKFIERKSEYDFFLYFHSLQNAVVIKGNTLIIR